MLLAAARATAITVAVSAKRIELPGIAELANISYRAGNGVKLAMNTLIDALRHLTST
jgi:hypothetical protein